MDLRFKYRGLAERVWPGRLVDTLTMTSYERQCGNIYGGVREPNFNVVSYTWGRWMLAPGEGDSPALHINNLTWELPRVDPRHFTATDLYRMLSHTSAATGNRFVWLDVACIDQSDVGAETRMIEISKTPGILANASVVLVWLSTVPTHALQKSWDSLELVLRPQNNGAHLHESFESMTELYDAVRTFLSDPRYSSVWVLQDEASRNDGLLVSREGELIETDTIPCNVYSIRLGLRIVSSILSNISADFNEDVSAIAVEMKMLIQDAGVLEPASNPNLSYISANYRSTIRQEDRIFGIQGLYGIHIGSAADSTTPRSFPELQEEFAIALNRKSFFLGQLFVHVGIPSAGKTWKIMSTARVPKGFDQWTPRHLTDDCSLDIRPGVRPHVSAKIAPFEHLIDFWKVRIKALPDVERNDQLLVVLDDYIRQGESSTSNVDATTADAQYPSSTFRQTQETVDWLIGNIGYSKLSVLMLGGLSFRPGLYTECFGLLILHDEQDRDRCQRVGLCKWEGNDFFGNMGISEEAKSKMPQFRQRYNAVMS